MSESCCYASFKRLTRKCLTLIDVEFQPYHVIAMQLLFPSMPRWRSFFFLLLQHITALVLIFQYLYIEICWKFIICSFHYNVSAEYISFCYLHSFLIILMTSIFISVYAQLHFRTPRYFHCIFFFILVSKSNRISSYNKQRCNEISLLKI